MKRAMDVSESHPTAGRRPRAASSAASLIASLTVLLLLVGCAAEPEVGRSTDDASTEGARPPAETAADDPSPTPAEPVTVATLSAPVDWLVARLAAPHVERSLVIPAGESPTFWRPPAEVIVDLQDADLIVMNGAGYEKWTAQGNLPLSRVLDTSEGLELIQVVGGTHSHGAGGEHSHVGDDPHLWMDPALYLEQARRVDAALEERGAASDGALEALEADLAALGEALERAASPLSDRAVAANHASYDYLAERVGLEVETIDLDPRSPSAAQVAAFEAWLGERGPAVLLWTEAPSEPARAALPADTRHVWFDTLEQPGEEGDYDYLAQARANVERLVAATGGD